MPKTFRIEVRHPRVDELQAVHNLVQYIVDSVYGGLWMEAPVHIGHSDWSKAWIACSASEFLGVLLTQDDWLDDLWIVEHARRSGLGKELMKLAEKEIAGRGFQTGKLRVVSTNQNAINFYKALGWLEIGLVAHDLFPIQMNEMCKALHK